MLGDGATVCEAVVAGVASTVRARGVALGRRLTTGTGSVMVAASASTGGVRTRAGVVGAGLVVETAIGGAGSGVVGAGRILETVHGGLVGQRLVGGGWLGPGLVGGAEVGVGRLDVASLAVGSVGVGRWLVGGGLVGPAVVCVGSVGTGSGGDWSSGIARPRSAVAVSPGEPGGASIGRRVSGIVVVPSALLTVGEAAVPNANEPGAAGATVAATPDQRTIRNAVNRAGGSPDTRRRHARRERIPFSENIQMRPVRTTVANPVASRSL